MLRLLVFRWSGSSFTSFPTRFFPKQISDSRAEDNSNCISLLIYNVLYDNPEVEKMRDLIRDTDPNLILLSEPTQRWFEQLDGLEDDYPYTTPATGE